MSKPIESAEEFARRVQGEVDCTRSDMTTPEVLAVIKARDNAVRLALLDEIREFAAAEPGVLWILEKLRAEHGL